MMLKCDACLMGLISNLNEIEIKRPRIDQLQNSDIFHEPAKTD